MPDFTQLLNSKHPFMRDSVENSENQIRVLLVDDDPEVRNLLCVVLRMAGYEVLTASDGQEAWTLFGQSLPRIAVLISDVEMPRMSGVELAKLAAKDCPNLPILLISGRPFPSDVQPTLCGFLQKPFLPAAFLKSVYGIVNQPKPPALGSAAGSAGWA